MFDFVDYIAILKEYLTGGGATRCGGCSMPSTSAMCVEAHPQALQQDASPGHPGRVCSASPTYSCSTSRPSDSTPSGLRFRQIVSEHAEHRCVVLSTHMTEDVEALCDRVIVMDLGSISFDGTTADLAGIAAGGCGSMTVPIRAPRSLGAPATVATATSARHRGRTTGADRAGRISPADRRDAGGGGVSTVTLQLARVEAARLARSPLVWLSIVPIAFWVRLERTAGDRRPDVPPDRLRIADPLLDDGDDGAVGVRKYADGGTAGRAGGGHDRRSIGHAMSAVGGGFVAIVLTIGFVSSLPFDDPLGRWSPYLADEIAAHGRTSPRSSRARWR